MGFNSVTTIQVYFHSFSGCCFPESA